MYNRFKFLKLIYRDSLVLILKSKGSSYSYVSFGRDRNLFKYLNREKKKLFKKLNKYHINYVLVDNLDIISERKFNDNYYYKFLKIAYLDKVLIDMKR